MASPSTGTIVGAVIGSLLGILALVFLVRYALKRDRSGYRRSLNEETDARGSASSVEEEQPFPSVQEEDENKESDRRPLSNPLPSNEQPDRGIGSKNDASRSKIPIFRPSNSAAPISYNNPDSYPVRVDNIPSSQTGIPPWKPNQTQSTVPLSNTSKPTSAGSVSRSGNTTDDHVKKGFNSSVSKMKLKRNTNAPPK